MSKLPYRVSHLRGANLIAANPQRMESKDGKRWACGRNVKVSTGYRTYDAVEVWSLRCRNSDGKVIVVAQHMDRKAAEDWVSKDGIAALQRWVRNGLYR